jgi:hypothetical protein
MKILGMEPCSRRKTDEEYIESVRRQVERSKWFGVFHACGCIFFLGAYWWIWRMLYSPDSPLAELPQAVGSGGMIGIALGAFAGIQLVLAGQNAIWAGQYFRGHRTERLMLRFHDELKGGGRA